MIFVMFFMMFFYAIESRPRVVAVPGKRLHGADADGRASFWLMAPRLPSLLSELRCTALHDEAKSVVPLFAAISFWRQSP